MKKKIIFIAFLFAFVCGAHAQIDNSRKLSLELFLDWEYVLNPQISPDGQQIVYTRRWTDKVNDRFENEIWIMNSDGSRTSRTKICLRLSSTHCGAISGTPANVV